MRQWAIGSSTPYRPVHSDGRPPIDRCLVEGVRERDDDGADAGAVAEEVVGHGVVGVLVVDDRLGHRGLEVLRFHELLLRVHRGLLDQIRVSEQPLNQPLNELTDLRLRRPNDVVWRGQS